MFTFTRDSSVWWLAIAGALIGYLISAQTPPTRWDYMQWLQFLSAAVGTIAGKLATSPLASKSEKREETRIEAADAAYIAGRKEDK